MALTLQQHISLRPYHTFGTGATARYFAVAHSEEDLREVLALPQMQGAVLWLGGGSNVLFTGNFEGLVVQVGLRGLAHQYLDEDWVAVTAGAGENWHTFVTHCLAQDWGGLENLALIPGQVGTAPMQNIGAYGVEIKDSLLWLEALSVKDGSLRRFTAADCEFGYRHSIFKDRLRGAYIITQVCFKLSRRHHALHTGYGAIQSELARQELPPSIQSIARVVCDIRRSKLPDPAVVGNAGSFFKNPVVPQAQAQALQQEHPTMPAYPAGEGQRKLAGGWLIEQCGWKGFRRDDAGVHPRQALVLVNYGKATGAAICQLADEVRQSVFRKFAIALETEVNII